MNEYMLEAYHLALKAYELDEVPIGCVIVKDGLIIGRGFNSKESNQDVTSHAEINAIKEASQYLNSWYLNDCILYTTLEPCLMCTGAIIQSRIKQVIYGSSTNRWDGFSRIVTDHMYNHSVDNYCSNDEECTLLIKKYFKFKRLRK